MEKNITERLSILALTRVQGLKVAHFRAILDAAGSASELFSNIDSIHDILPGAHPDLIAALSDATVFDRAKREMDFIEKNGIRLFCLNDDDYPYRLRECNDAPIAIYMLGNANLNSAHVVSVVGTRHATEYGKDVCNAFVAELARLLPDALIVSGLAYGMDVCAHRAAMKAGLPTIGVLAHGLDNMYPTSHRNVARQMLADGGLLTEFMSETIPFPQNFVQRNRIVAGMADATVVVESAAKGGSLITASLAQGYTRDCFAFPGRVNDRYSIGCNELIAQNRAALITSAYDLVEAMNWKKNIANTSSQSDAGLFPELSSDEERIMTLLAASSDGMQMNRMVIELDMPVQMLMPILIELEMRGLVRTAAGGIYRAAVAI